MERETAVIIGAGPAGLTAAYELLTRTNIKPIVYETESMTGGISKTIEYKGNRIDLGGHRFFSKSDRVLDWWFNILPLETSASDTSAADSPKAVMLLRNRLSRILFRRKFFDYPVSLKLKTLKNLGLLDTLRVGLSFARARLLPLKHEENLEEFFINRFGRRLYDIFFRDYTEKVWGVKCTEIGADWGAQRIKGLSAGKAVLHAAKKLLPEPIRRHSSTETSLIEQFYYPKYGPGQLWERVASLIEEKGGEINLNCQVVGVSASGNRITGVRVRERESGREYRKAGEYFFSSMPVKDLIASLDTPIPPEVREVAEDLQYREFITVGLLLRKLGGGEGKLKDNWIYIQENDVNICRLQIFNNWSPYMVADDEKAWVGVEYICSEGDRLWNLSDSELAGLAEEEMMKIGMIEKDDVLDSLVIRVARAYPAYFGSYHRLGIIKQFTNRFDNLFLLGRNGMHHYNNQDHSMLSAMIAVDNIVDGVSDKENIWNVNAEKDYSEER